MPKGLFQVFHDDDLSPPPAMRSIVSKPKVRRKPVLGGGLSGALASCEGTGGVGKENYDPFAAGVGSTKGGRGCGGSKGDKQHASLPPKVVAPRLASSNRPPATMAAASSSNDVCTGTLRTRVIPDLPPLPRSFRSHHNPYPSAVRSKVTTPSTVEVDEAVLLSMLYPSRVESFGTPSSAKDSGYAQSEVSRSEIEGEDELDGLGLQLGFESVVDSDTLARNLTESPLAEITQAYTGLGGFSIHCPSPYPSNTLSTSPTLSYSSLPICDKSMKPYTYSTNSTTRKPKPPAPTKPVDTLGQSIKSMRL